MSVNVFKFFLITADTVREISYALSNPNWLFRPTSDIANMILFLKERESVKPNHLICDPVRAKEVSHSFCYEENDLRAV